MTAAVLIDLGQGHPFGGDYRFLAALINEMHAAEMHASFRLAASIRLAA